MQCTRRSRPLASLVTRPRIVRRRARRPTPIFFCHWQTLPAWLHEDPTSAFQLDLRHCLAEGEAYLAPARVHVLPVTRTADRLFPTLADALLHPRTTLPLHVSEKGDRPVAKRLRRSMGSKAVLAVL